MGVFMFESLTDKLGGALRKLRGVSQKNIAARLGLSEQTVQVQAARGLRRVTESLRRSLKHP